MASLFQKLKERRNKKRAIHTKHKTEALSVGTSHTSEPDVESPNCPQHLKGSSVRTLKKSRSDVRTRDPSKQLVPERKLSAKVGHDSHSKTERSNDHSAPHTERVAHFRSKNSHDTSQTQGSQTIDGSDHGDLKHHHKFNLGQNSGRAALTVQGSVSYDSEDETTATSTSTIQRKLGKNAQLQVATLNLPRTGRLEKSSLTTSNTEVPMLTPDEIERQNSANRETERISKAAAALDNRGNEYFEKGHYDKAMEAYMEALKLKRLTFHSMMEEADDLFDEAEESKNIESRDRDMDPKLLVSMATSINNIGYLRQRAGEATPDETMAAYKKSLRIKRKILGSDSLSVGKTLNNIGSVYYLKKEFDNAMPAYDEAMKIMQGNLGMNHPDVATVISNMGDVNLALKKKREALDHYRVALGIRWNAFGEKDPRTMRLLEKIARIEVGDQMPTPRGTKVERQNYDWDESELYDLDLRPLSYELRLLKDQVKEDIAAVNRMEKTIAMGMVRDKLKIVRGMRDLIDDQDHSEGSYGALRGSNRCDASQREDCEDGSNHAYDDILDSPGMLPAMTGNRSDGGDDDIRRDKYDVHGRVQERLAKLRIQNGLDPVGPLDLPLKENTLPRDGVQDSRSDVADPSSFSRSVVGSKIQQPSLSLAEREEVKRRGSAVELSSELRGFELQRSASDPGLETEQELETDFDNRDGNFANTSLRLSRSTDAIKEGSSHEEVKSFFQDLMARPIERSSRRSLHATWLGTVAVAAAPHEADSSDSDSSDCGKEFATTKVAPKLLHTTWLGEIES